MASSSSEGDSSSTEMAKLFAFYRDHPETFTKREHSSEFIKRLSRIYSISTPTEWFTLDELSFLRAAAGTPTNCIASQGDIIDTIIHRTDQPADSNPQSTHLKAFNTAALILDNISYIQSDREINAILGSNILTFTSIVDTPSPSNALSIYGIDEAFFLSCSDDQ